MKSKLSYAKSVDPEKKVVKALVSTFDWDRTNERFAPGAWDLNNFKKNPVVLWGHDNTKPPIGKAVSIEETEAGLVAETVFDDQSDYAMNVFSLYERGFLNAFSVGFLPKPDNGFMMEEREGGRKGVVYTDIELLEYSAVSIPANPGAIVARDLADLVIKALGPSAILTSKGKTGETEFLVAGGDLPVRGIEPDAARSVHKGEALADPFESGLNDLIRLAKISKSNPLDRTKISLIKSSIDVLQEIIEETKDEITMSDIARLEEALSKYGEVVVGLHPDNSNLMEKTLREINRALKIVR
jgi:HK97 family phage prohead protease